MENSSVVFVCIDDFALKKRQRYGTVMVDIETRKIIDMIESRETSDVSRWLSEYPNLSVVSRDGSLSYAIAISKAHPGAIQVSDRFHIIKNLNDRAKQVFQRVFQGRVAIPITAETQSIKYEALIGTKSERIKLVKKLRGEGRSKDEIIQITGLSTRMVKNYISIREGDIPEDKHTVRGREHEDAVKKLMERADRVKILRKEGLSYEKISQITGFSYVAVRKYLSADFTPINGHYGKQQGGKLTPYREDVFRWKTEGLTYREIHERILEKGYTGTQDAIRGFISKERRVRRSLHSAVVGDSIELIDKKWIIRLLYKPIEEVKGITAEQLTAIYDNYPLAKAIIDVVNEFKQLLKAKSPDLLFPWMDKAMQLNIPEINAFIDGLKQDIDAVTNAISSDFSNGLVEGVINKIKVIKRTMYGRCGFDVLRNKCLMLDHQT